MDVPCGPGVRTCCLWSGATPYHHSMWHPPSAATGRATCWAKAVGRRPQALATLWRASLGRLQPTSINTLMRSFAVGEDNKNICEAERRQATRGRVFLHRQIPPFFQRRKEVAFGATREAVPCTSRVVRTVDLARKTCGIYRGFGAEDERFGGQSRA